MKCITNNCLKQSFEIVLWQEFSHFHGQAVACWTYRTSNAELATLFALVVKTLTHGPLSETKKYVKD